MNNDVYGKNNEGNVDNDKSYHEWKACNEAISKLDSILIDPRNMVSPLQLS